jgi:hypothetical protein
MTEQFPESASNRREINLDEYPELVGCNIMSQINIHDVVTEVEVTDAEGQQVIFEVPDEAIRRFNVHHLYHGLPEGLRDVLKDELARGIVACKVVEKLDDERLVRIELPTKSEERLILVPAESLARRV